MSYFFRTAAYFLFKFEPRGGIDPPIALTKALAGVITEMPCSVVAEMSTNNSKIFPAFILVKSAVCHNCGKF